MNGYPVYERLGDVRSRAVTMGKIAGILQSRGEPEEALQIRREEELPVYERLGDVRERAVTMGKIADILQSRGELEEALQIRQEEELPVYERLGDVRERAVAMTKIGRINLQQGNYQDAFENLEETYLIASKLGDLEGIIYVGIDLSQLLCVAGNKEEGVVILNRSREGLLKLGRETEAHQLQPLIDQLGESQQ